MSRAFIKEQDEVPEELTTRPVSPNPNFVTARGMRLIDETLDGLRKSLAAAQHDGDRAAVARVSRDLRYWLQRRTSAQLVEPPPGPKAVAFATRVTIERDDGRKLRFAIVGEDEADPAQGRIAYASPMARALLGKAVGEFAEAPGGEVEIIALEAVDPEG
ncbi:MAG: transcription elongation factor GreA [Rhizobiales bacterium]|nr:transcription elongation factor GreA [Hyphomicrobiales bacterium]MBI3674064.1 transcription elongation factor GreA [Hyphomicrobiales bacterium]